MSRGKSTTRTSFVRIAIAKARALEAARILIERNAKDSDDKKKAMVFIEGEISRYASLVNN